MTKEDICTVTGYSMNELESNTISIIAGGDKYSWFLSNFDNEEI